jgi:quercetin dioxygenase-like cupin family protein
MFPHSIKNVAAILVVAALSGLAVLLVAPASAQQASAQQPNVTRTILQHDVSAVPGYDVNLVAVEIPVGGREGRHFHSGLIMVYVKEGILTFDYEGRPTATYRPGDTFYVEPGKIHEGRNNGTVPVRVLATFIAKKGQPLTTQVE